MPTQRRHSPKRPSPRKKPATVNWPLMWLLALVFLVVLIVSVWGADYAAASMAGQYILFFIVLPAVLACSSANIQGLHQKSEPQEVGSAIHLWYLTLLELGICFSFVVHCFAASYVLFHAGLKLPLASDPFLLGTAASTLALSTVCYCLYLRFHVADKLRRWITLDKRRRRPVSMHPNHRRKASGMMDAVAVFAAFCLLANATVSTVTTEGAASVLELIAVFDYAVLFFLMPAFVTAVSHRLLD